MTDQKRLMEQKKTGLGFRLGLRLVFVLLDVTYSLSLAFSIKLDYYCYCIYVILRCDTFFFDHDTTLSCRVARAWVFRLFNTWGFVLNIYLLLGDLYCTW